MITYIKLLENDIDSMESDGNSQGIYDKLPGHNNLNTQTSAVGQGIAKINNSINSVLPKVPQSGPTITLGQRG